MARTKRSSKDHSPNPKKVIKVETPQSETSQFVKIAIFIEMLFECCSFYFFEVDDEPIYFKGVFPSKLYAWFSPNNYCPLL